MEQSISRRDFIRAAASSGLVLNFSSNLRAAQGPSVQAARPVVIASANGLRAVTRAMEIIKAGGSALDGVIAGVNIVEDDPEDMTVGYGGLPNEEGEVELDASVMDGRTHRAGAVGALRYIKNPSKVARLVMERTDHIFLVGEGALRFALAHGFRKENLLTEKARQKWLEWKEALSDRDNWLNEEQSEVVGPEQRSSVRLPKDILDLLDHAGTINCCAVDLKGDIAGVTTTSGLPFKIAGRVGDSPIIGAGLYVDNEVGAAGSTGRGEANIKICGAHLVVEAMRRGASPTEACLAALERVVKTTREKRLLDEKGRPRFNLNFYAINKKGEFGAASMWSGGRFAVHDGTEARHVDSAFLFKREGK